MVALSALHLGRDALLARLNWSVGTEGAAGSRAAYEAGARVARPPWRPGLGPAADRLSLTDRPTEAARAIAVVRFSDEAVRGLRDLADDRPARTPAGRDALLGAAIMPLVRAVLPGTGWGLEGDALHIGLSRGAVGLSHTTINARTGLHVGLHLASWDRLGPLERHRASNRLCLNLGEGPRHLLFVPRPASALVAGLAAHGLDVTTDEEALRDSTGRLDLARRYLETFPEEPVLRVRVLPGEAYVAPTENLIHDGGSEDGVARDVSLTIRGFFVACPVAAPGGAP